MQTYVNCGARVLELIGQGYSIGGPRARCGPDAAQMRPGHGPDAADVMRHF
ncbi:Hypothetical protein FKW44_012901 [Caligus rogercresseyi]|uniref:Uncharacterized protein n=1 Tax=Caligus rogercresseyi TaxID=217165 RepID=A0A7T8HK10_CALRO|nr:Hypothetical protein FKW44_012901 [Caligus rogercresseyi]